MNPAPGSRVRVFCYSTAAKHRSARPHGSHLERQPANISAASRQGGGDALPSVRSVAAEFTLNPLTVLKGYQQLVDEGLVEKRRGRGMFVTEGSRAQLLRGERQRFLEQEWPRVLSTIERLGLDVTELVSGSGPKRKSGG
jgi:GntR family transcriptional regulator